MHVCGNGTQELAEMIQLGLTSGLTVSFVGNPALTEASLHQYPWELNSPPKKKFWLQLTKGNEIHMRMLLFPELFVYDAKYHRLCYSTYISERKIIAAICKSREETKDSLHDEAFHKLKSFNVLWME